MKRHGLVLSVVFLFSCGPDGNLPRLQDTVYKSEQGERWSVMDDATLFGLPIEHNLAKLPTQGAAATIPWVGSYWPIYQDSINYRWGGPYTESAAAKYGRAYGIGGVEDAVSRFHGMDVMGYGRSCYNDSSCGYGSVCGRRSHWYTGRCVPIWWGICQAWASAAILHPEPRHAVVYNGVQFETSDLKGLMSLVYHTPKVKQISMRCELPAGAIPYDGVGRPADLSCRDSNPGTYHLLLANLLGIRQQPFVEDRSLDQDVWNQPLRAFRVARMQEVSARVANDALGVRTYDESYAYNAEAARLVYVKTEVYFIKEADASVNGYLGDDIDQYTFLDVYEYILELDRAGNIIGGEWALGSKSDHPDFLWIPEGPQSVAAAGGAISFENVMDLVHASY